MAHNSPVPGSNGDHYIPFDQRTGDTSVVYFTRDLSAQGLVNIFRRVGGVLTGNVAVKVHTGEQHGPNIIPRSWVKALMEQELPGSEQWLYPMHLTAMCYTVFPEQGKDISIYDCAESDKPIKIAQNTEPFAPEAQNGMVYFGNVVCETDDAEKKLHTIYSSLHFEPVTDDVEWCVIFHLKQFEEESFLLI